ncbi:MAG TPA: LysR family transcriptional regulator [Candidatus Limnocylindrales bacterium]|nr:LysR family transcriptional regulator [Candidatus Limnocylindrales bacterium]
MKSNVAHLDRLDLNKLITFLVIAESGGVAAAARQLSLTRSAISHSLAALESALGATLFHRVGKTMVLTPEGRRLRAVVSDARDRLSEALTEVLGGSKEVSGTVRVGLFTGFSRFRIAAVVDEFTRQYPAARVRVGFGPQSWLAEELTAGRLDFTLSLRPGGPSLPHIRSQRLFEQSLVLAAPPSKSRRIMNPEALSRLALIDYYQSDPLIDRWARHHFGARRAARDRIRCWVATTDLAVELVLRGAGAAVLPSDVAEPFQEEGRLSVLRGPREPMRDPVWLNQLASARRVKALDAFRELLVREAP